VSEHPLSRTADLIALDAFPGLGSQECIETLTGVRIRLAADSTSLLNAGGQTALAAAFLSLAQMGFRITLDFPDVPLIGRQPPLEGATIRSAVEAHAEQLVQPCVDDREHDLTIGIGAIDPGHGGYSVSPGEPGTQAVRGSRGVPWRSPDPIAATMAGVLAAAVALPIALRRLESSFGLKAPSHLRTQPDQITVAFPALPGLRLDIGDVDVVSAGAITNACLFVLLRSDVIGSLRVFDDDRFEVTNLNRYALLRRPDLGRPKVDRLRDFTTARLSIAGTAARYPSPSQSQPASRVLVGADNLKARRGAQLLEPRWLHVAGTTHFEVISSSHEPGRACAGCVHPRDDAAEDEVIPTISYVSMLAGVLQAQALLESAASRRPVNYYCWANNLGGPSGIWPFDPKPNPACPLRCQASRNASTDSGERV
jgi:hypothetical protein